MTARTPYDDHADQVAKSGYHGHRGSGHMDVVSRGILRDLREKCAAIREDLDDGTIGCWVNCTIPWGEGEWAGDIILAEPQKPAKASKSKPANFAAEGAASVPGAKPDGRKLRLVVEHKSVVTAHRNKNSRGRELNDDVNNANNAGWTVVVAATILIGTAPKVLNVVDGVRRLYKDPARRGKYLEDKFEAEVGERLKAKDPAVWKDLHPFVSENRATDPADTVTFFRQVLPVRPQGSRAQRGLDALLLVPVYYDNVGTARVDRSNSVGIDVDAEYADFLRRLCTAYSMRWR